MKTVQRPPHEGADKPVVEYGRPRPYLNAAPATLAVFEPSRWAADSACVGMPTHLWFADTRSRRAAQATRVCATCPVQPLCLGASLVYGDEYGIWGGLPPEEREPLSQRLRDGEPLIEVLKSAARPRRRRGKVA